MSNVTDSYLAHHGILGMRWGHRKIDPFANHQANIQKRAEENGLSKRKAKIIAKKRITAEKVLLVYGGIVLGVAAFKFHNSVKNRISDKTMNVMLQDVKEISDSEATKAAVAAYTKMTIPSIATYTAVGAGIKLGITNKYVAKNKKKEESNV